MKCGWQAVGARGGSGLLRTGARQSRARWQAQVAAGLRARVAQARDSDCWGSADGGAGLAQGTEALGKGGSGSGGSAGDWWLGPAVARGKLKARRLSAGAAGGSGMKGMEMRGGKKPFFYKAAWANERSLW